MPSVMHLSSLESSTYRFPMMTHCTAVSRLPQLPSSLASPSHSPEPTGLQKLVKQAMRSSKASLQRADSFPGRLNQICFLRLTDGTRLVLKCRPQSTTRILRHEHRSLESEARVLDLLASLSAVVPVAQVLRLDPTSFGPLHTPYLLTTFQRGSRLCAVAPKLSPELRIRVDRSLGAHLRSITDVRGPAFGSPVRVLVGQGVPSWRTAFAIMLEAALRDAEDMLVSVPYDAIRSGFRANVAAFAEVREPRLVLPQAADERNVLVDEKAGVVVGLLGVGNAVWGDPLLAEVWSVEEGPSDAFCEGYFGGQVGRPKRSGGERTRLMLYAVYRALIAVVTNQYRPRHEDAELEARRNLNRALKQLSAMTPPAEPREFDIVV